MINLALALALEALGDVASARAGFERALRIDEAAYGPDHPNTLMVRRNLEALDAV